MEKTTFNNLVGNLGESLGKLDSLLSEFKGRPMYSEWLEIDEVTILKDLCEREPEENVDNVECQYADLEENTNP